MLTHGYFLPLDSGSRLASALTAPIEAYRHGTGVLEGYRYAKAREDQLLDEARRNTGGLGTGAEILGGIARGLKPAGFIQLAVLSRPQSTAWCAVGPRAAAEVKTAFQNRPD